MKLYSKECPDGVEVEERQEAAFKAAGWDERAPKVQEEKPMTAAQKRAATKAGN